MQQSIHHNALPTQMAAVTNTESRGINLVQLIRAIEHVKWWVLGGALMGGTFGLAYCALTPPVYEANALIEVLPTENPLTGNYRTPPNDNANPSIPTEADMRILSSMVVLRPTVDQLGLNVAVTPESRWVQLKSHVRDQLDARDLGQPENLPVIRHLKADMQQVGQPLVLQVGAQNQYALLSQTGQALLTGVTGQMVRKNGTEIFVSRLPSSPGRRFHVQLLSSDEIVSRMQNHLYITPVGSASRLVQLSYYDEQPIRAVNTLNAIIQNYQYLRTSWSDNAAQHDLAFITNQLKNVAAQMTRMPSDSTEAAAMKRYYVVLLDRQQVLRTLAAVSMLHVRVVDAAHTAARPKWPRPAPVLLLSTLLGMLILGGGVGLSRSIRRQRRDPAVLAQSLGIPVLADLPASSAQAHFFSVATSDRMPQSYGATAGSLDGLRNYVLHLKGDAGNRIIAITGIDPSSKSQQLTCALAEALAGAGQRVLWISNNDIADLAPNLGCQLATPGLSEVLAGSVRLETALQPTQVEGVTFLTAGHDPIRKGAAEIMSREFLAVLQQMAEMFDVILLDTPPLSTGLDSALIARRAESHWLVIRRDRCSRDQLLHGLHELHISGADPSGIILW